jgi:hypothetical protein
VGWPGCKNEQHRLSKKVIGSCFGGGRPVGRPRNRWEDVIQTDAANLLRIRNWKAVARDNEEWRKKVGEAMDRKRAEAPQKKKKKLSSIIRLSDTFISYRDYISVAGTVKGRDESTLY